VRERERERERERKRVEKGREMLTFALFCFVLFY
jgi:hypothetical protein